MALFSIDAIKKTNDKAGLFFFSPSTMRWFKSRVSSNVFPTPHGAVFITSERNDGYPRLFTTRYIHENTGHIETIGEFQEFKSRSGALKAAERRAKNIADFIEEEREQQA